MKKMDEMELHIRDKGIKWSWFFTILALFGWGIYDYIKLQSLPIPLILLFIQFLVYFFITNIAKYKVGDKKGKEEIVCFFAGLLFYFCISTLVN
ncbi:MAG: hypothetical protein LBM93_04785 [Oscillospiraceae bacterium]|jgi:uncharacterized membrane protein YfhO|nr:hypothetical protein [Oscillospiraceae bacterium]